VRSLKDSIKPGDSATREMWGIRTFLSSLETCAKVPNLAAPLLSASAFFFLMYAGAWRLVCSQLLGAAGPGGGLEPPTTRRVLALAFGLGALTSGMCRMRRSSGGTVRLLTAAVSSSRTSGVALGACSRRSCCMRWLTVCVPAGDDTVAGARELCNEGWT